MNATEKKRWPYDQAMSVAAALVELLKPYCARIEIAGSLRRRKAAVGDIEILFIPLIQEARHSTDFFLRGTINLADQRIEQLLQLGEIIKRPNVKGCNSWGEKNKLGIHAESGIPVDFFTATRENWWNYLVCRTGPAESNMAIASKAKAKGWQWKPYSPGFISSGGTIRDCKSEAEVFGFVGLPCLHPSLRK